MKPVCPHCLGQSWSSSHIPNISRMGRKGKSSKQRGDNDTLGFEGEVRPCYLNLEDDCVPLPTKISLGH